MEDCGGWTEVKPVTLEVIKICLEVSKWVNNKDGTNLYLYIPVVYRSQHLAGENYLVKVMVDEEGGCVHVKIYQPFTKGGKPSVTGVEFSKSFDDPLIPF